MPPASPPSVAIICFMTLYFTLILSHSSPKREGSSKLIKCHLTRNACQLLEDPKLAADMVKLAIADALGFDVTTQTGGPDGSVLLEMDRYV